MMGTLFFNCNYCNCNQLLFTYSSLLIVNYSLLIDFHFYEAFESSVQFEVHAEGISLDIEVRSYVQSQTPFDILRARRVLQVSLKIDEMGEDFSL